MIRAEHGMSRRLPRLLGAALLLAAAAPALAQRVVTLGGAITEIVYALGADDKLVGTDASSQYPAATAALPKVGYYRDFSIEGVASLRPDLVIASDQAGPPNAMAQLRQLVPRVIVLPAAPTLEALLQRIDGVAAALGRPVDGTVLAARIQEEVKRVGRAPAGRRVLLVSSRGGRLEAAGSETAADHMLRLAGASNVMAGERGYKPISGESAAALRPDVIVTTTMSVAALGGLDAFITQPGIAVTPAGRAKRVVVMDDLLLLGFGPRLPEALRQLQSGIAAAP